MEGVKDSKKKTKKNIVWRFCMTSETEFTSVTLGTLAS
jgi:hypothetical protein